MLQGNCVNTKHRFRGELILVADWRVEPYIELSKQRVFGNAAAQNEGMGRRFMN